MVMQEPVPGGWVSLGHPGPVVSPVSQPAAGADFTYHLPANEIVRVLSVFGHLTTSATVATRQPVLEITDADGNILVRSSVGSDVTASSATHPSWWIGGQLDTANSGGTQGGLPDMWLPPGCVVQGVTPGLSAGDQWDLLVVTFERRPYAPQWGPSTGD